MILKKWETYYWGNQITLKDIITQLNNLYTEFGDVKIIDKTDRGSLDRSLWDMMDELRWLQKRLKELQDKQRK